MDYSELQPSSIIELLKEHFIPTFWLVIATKKQEIDCQYLGHSLENNSGKVSSFPIKSIKYTDLEKMTLILH